MNRGSARRRLRLRRRRKGESSPSKLLEISRSSAGAEVVDDSSSFGREIAEEVVFRAGCCVVEAIATGAVLAALLTVPAYLLLTRMT